MSNTIYCLECSGEIISKHARKFCSKSCSATYNNRKLPKRKAPPPNQCARDGCDNLTSDHNRKYCSNRCSSMRPRSKSKNLRYTVEITDEYLSSIKDPNQREFCSNLLFDVIEPLEKPIHKLYPGVIRLLNHLEYPITYQGFYDLRKLIHDELHVNHLSPKEITEKYSIEYKDFGCFIKTGLGIRLKSIKQAGINRHIKDGTRVTDEKILYKKECEFKFDPYIYPDIPGYELLLERGIYHPVDNPNGVARDHIISREHGWRNNIDPKIIASPHNCQFIPQIENSRKGSGSGMTIEQLKELIETNSYKKSNTIKKLRREPKTPEQRLHLSKISSQYMTITNGSVNTRILKGSEIPDGWRRGITRKKKTNTYKTRPPKTPEQRAHLSKMTAQYMTITDGYTNKRVLKDTEIPEGWRRGIVRRNTEKKAPN